MSRAAFRVCVVLFLAGVSIVADPQNTLPPLDPDARAITIAAVGDIMMGSTFPDASKLPPDDGGLLLAPFVPLLKDADITFGNLEGPLLEGGVSTKCGPAATAGSCFAFRVPTRYGAYLKDAGFTVLNLANNHAGDFGAPGRASTRKVLDDLGIAHIGSERGRYATTVLQVKGTRIGFIGFAFNDVAPNINDLSDAKHLVAALKKQVDIVVVSFHNGAEGVTHQHVGSETEIFYGEKRGNPRAFAHAVMDAGADLVLGHGPHVLRGMELYRDRLIVYSMGNFCTYGMFNLKAETGLTALFKIRLAPDGTFLDGKLIPGHQEGEGGPTPDPDRRAIALIDQLSTADFGPTAPQINPDGTFKPWTRSSTATELRGLQSNSKADGWLSVLHRNTASLFKAHSLLLPGSQLTIRPAEDRASPNPPPR